MVVVAEEGRAVSDGRRDEGLEVHAFGDQGLDPRGELRGAAEEVRPVRGAPKGVRGEGVAQGGEDVWERREGA